MTELQVKEEKSFNAEATEGTQEHSFVRETSRMWEPMDNQNFTYMERLTDREKQGTARDFIREHKVGNFWDFVNS